MEDKWDSWSQGKVWKTNISDRMARDLVRNAQENPHITAKELQKGIADTGLAVHRTTMQHTLKPTWQSCQKEQPQHKRMLLKYAKENIEPEAFWNNVLWTDETKI